MSRTASHSPTDPAARLLIVRPPEPQPSIPSTHQPSLLRPWALLRRLRPVKVSTLAGRLREWRRSIAGLELLRQHFPDTLRAYDALTEPKWWEILAHLLNQVEESDGFEVDWNLLNMAWAWWMEGDEESEADQGNALAAFLLYLPLKLYGFSQSDLLHSTLPVQLLHALLSPQVQAVTSSLLLALEIYDQHFEEVWGPGERARAWEILGAVEQDPGRYPEPVRWLLELARWVGHTTHNPILDLAAGAGHPDTADAWPPSRFTWANDLAEVQSAWRRARPVIHQLERLERWVEDDASRLSLLYTFFSEGTYDQLDW
ncbi:MAG: hypothetical protein KJ077_46145 [Anaerolineae bacterium]|nr:hypothetical protein [Anaerolineae bacterium]